MHLKLFTKETKIFFKLLPYLADAYYDNKRHITIKELSALSGVLLHGNSLSMLVQAKIIHNAKVGSRSNLGYLFSRDPQDITALEVVQVIQGMPYIICTSEWYEKTGNICPVCKAMGEGLDKAIEALRNLTLYEYAQVVKTGMQEDDL